MYHALHSEETCVLAQTHSIYLLATGDSYKSLQYFFRVVHNTISHIVPDTWRAIIAVYSVYGDEELKTPKSPDEWKLGFEDRWNPPHCVGAIDGKHIRLLSPSFGGTYYYIYIQYFSIILLAIVDSAYKFLYVDVG